MSGNSLDTLLGESNGVTGDNGWSHTFVDFDFSSSVSLSGGTDYAIVLTRKKTDSTNTPTFDYTAAKTGFDGGVVAYYSNKTQSLDYTSYDSKMKIYTD